MTRRVSAARQYDFSGEIPANPFAVLNARRQAQETSINKILTHILMAKVKAQETQEAKSEFENPYPYKGIQDVPDTLSVGNQKIPLYGLRYDSKGRPSPYYSKRSSRESELGTFLGAGNDQSPQHPGEVLAQKREGLSAEAGVQMPFASGTGQPQFLDTLELQAQQAIKAGADPEAVKGRLAQMRRRRGSI